MEHTYKLTLLVCAFVMSARCEQCQGSSHSSDNKSKGSGATLKYALK